VVRCAHFGVIFDTGIVGWLRDSTPSVCAIQVGCIIRGVRGVSMIAILFGEETTWRW
jgi:hypothetical protein